MKGWQMICRGVGGVAAGALLASVVSCEVGPDYVRPVMPVPTTFKSASAMSQPSTQPLRTLTTNWWLLFNDPELTRLEELATANNQGLQAAMARVMEERAALGVTKSGLYPQLTLDPAVTRQHSPSLSRNNNNNGNNNHGANDTVYSVPFDLSYEVDVWGRVRRTVESARATLNASKADYYVVLQTLQSDVATNYFTMRSYDAQQAILTRTVQTYKKQLELVKLQLKAGLVSNTDEAEAEAELDSTMTQEIDLRRQRAVSEHAIAVLLGKPPAEVSIAVRTEPIEPPVIPTGMPAELLRHRPDVAEAEQNVIAANANVGAAVANFYPKLTLSATAGFETLDSSKIFDWESRLLSIGPAISAPIFEGGLLRSQLEQAKESYHELVATYRGTLLTALQDVEDSLVNIQSYGDELHTQIAAVKASRDYVRLTYVQYQGGLITALQLIDADRTLLTNELSKAQLDASRLISTVQLIKAVGGGWDSQGSAASQPNLPRHEPDVSETTSR